MKKIKLSFILIKIINFYQKHISPDTGFLKRTGFFKKSVCVFYPTCSEYTKQALEEYGFFKGLFLGIQRVLRCHPWQKNHLDPLK
jgi:putative membrane protein insertion efficiency factor